MIGNIVGCWKYIKETKIILIFVYEFSSISSKVVSIITNYSSTINQSSVELVQPG
jgi:hypothetical protein